MHISFATASFKSPRHRFQLYPLSSHHCIHLTHPLPCPSLITVGFDCIQILLLGQRRMHRGGICCTPHLSGGGGAASIPDVMDQVSEAINNNDGANPFWGIQLSRATGLWLSLQRIFLTCFDFFFSPFLPVPRLGSSPAIISPPGACLFELSRPKGRRKGPKHKVCNSY